MRSAVLLACMFPLATGNWGCAGERGRGGGAQTPRTPRASDVLRTVPDAPSAGDVLRSTPPPRIPRANLADRLATLRRDRSARLPRVERFVSQPVLGGAFVLLRAALEGDRPPDTDEVSNLWLVGEEGVADLSSHLVTQDPDTYAGRSLIVRELQVVGDPRQGLARLVWIQDSRPPTTLAVIAAGPRGIHVLSSSCDAPERRLGVCGAFWVCAQAPPWVALDGGEGWFIDHHPCSDALHDISDLASSAMNAASTRTLSRLVQVPFVRELHGDTELSPAGEPACHAPPAPLPGVLERALRRERQRTLVRQYRDQYPEQTAEGRANIRAFAQRLRTAGLSLQPFCRGADGAYLAIMNEVPAEGDFLYRGYWQVHPARPRELYALHYREMEGELVRADFTGDGVVDIVLRWSEIEGPGADTVLLSTEVGRPLPLLEGGLDGEELLVRGPRGAVFFGAPTALGYDGARFGSVEFTAGTPEAAVAAEITARGRTVSALNTRLSESLGELPTGAPRCAHPPLVQWQRAVAQDLCTLGASRREVEPLLRAAAGTAHCPALPWPSPCP